ncbi:MAG: hypothetical protein CMQ38_05755 [Gammaproteobacteria bacterium]|nr:hypothetical protein [Gammaproteobacteria bacterium]
MRVLFFFLTLTLVMCWGLSQKALAVNEYLNDYPTHCSKGSWELYTEVDRYDYDQRMNSDSDYFGDSGKIGIRFRKEFGSTCTDPYKKMMIENMELKQELELLKLCGRYKELDLGPNFATVREKCKDVNKKND